MSIVKNRMSDEYNWMYIEYIKHSLVHDYPKQNTNSILLEEVWEWT